VSSLGTVLTRGGENPTKGDALLADLCTGPAPYTVKHAAYAGRKHNLSIPAHIPSCWRRESSMLEMCLHSPHPPPPLIAQVWDLIVV
jgi:hypothetical protein